MWRKQGKKNTTADNTQTKESVITEKSCVFSGLCSAGSFGSPHLASVTCRDKLVYTNIVPSKMKWQFKTEHALYDDLQKSTNLNLRRQDYGM